MVRRLTSTEITIRAFKHSFGKLARTYSGHGASLDRSSGWLKSLVNASRLLACHACPRSGNRARLLCANSSQLPCRGTSVYSEFDETSLYDGGPTRSFGL